MPDKTLKSLKFPGLNGTYYIPQLANDYDEDTEYWYGCFCNYEGDLYCCIYTPLDEYSDYSITGPFNPAYWRLVSRRSDAGYSDPGQFANFIGSYIFNGITRPYDPSIGYMSGQCVDYDGAVWYCVRQTPYPAGEFEYDYWTPFYPYDDEGYVAGAISSVMRSQNYQNLLAQSSSISEVKQLDMDSISWTLMNYNPDDDNEFEYAYCVIDLESDFDYLISFPGTSIDDAGHRIWNWYSSFPICFKTCLKNEIDINELMSLNPLFNLNDFKTLSYMENAEDKYYSEDYDYGQYKRIKWNSKNPFDTIIISVSSPDRAIIQDSDPAEYSDSQTQFLSVDDFSYLSSFLSISQLKAADSASTEQMFKLVQQDYTEVYKSQSDNIIEYDLRSSHAYTDTKKIPLNEGNVALQFINFSDAWKDIDIELRVYNNKFGTNESIKLKNSDKHIYIVDKNIGSNGELVEWDYFKLRFRYENDHLSGSQIDFVNSTLNILRKPKTQSNPNPTLKNNPLSVKQFIDLARTFKKVESLYIINQPTFLQATSEKYFWTDNFSIDASTFIEACLKGLSFDNTPYSTGQVVPEQYKRGDQSEYIQMSPYDWVANTNVYSWAIDPYQDRSYRWSIYSDQFEGGSTFPSRPTIMDAVAIFNECGTLAKWMVDKGWRIDTVSNLHQSEKPQNIQPGDILFFAEEIGIEGMFKFPVADMFPGYNYRNITHAAIVTATEVIPDLVGGDTPYGYRIKIISTPSLLQNYLKQTSGHFEYDPTMEYELQGTNIYTNTNNLSHYMPSAGTFVLACRPDLSSHKKSYLEIEAENLGLHVVPENEFQLEIIKKCRLCSDIEWTPGRDYDRPMPLTSLQDLSGTMGMPPGASAESVEYYEFVYPGQMIDGKFKAGVKYKGLPWTAYLPDDAYDETKAASNNYPYYTGKDNKIHPQQFLSIIQNENCPVYIDEDDNNKVYPIYGWNSPIDLIKYVFGQESCCYGLVDDNTDYIFYNDDGYYFDTLVDFEGYTVFGDAGPGGSHFNNFFPQLIRLGQVFFIPGDVYVGIITDFIKDELGYITNIEVTEATRYGLVNPRDKEGQRGNLIRRKMYTRNEFLDWYHLFESISQGNLDFIPDQDLQSQ